MLFPDCGSDARSAHTDGHATWLAIPAHAAPRFVPQHSLRKTLSSRVLSKSKSNRRVVTTVGRRLCYAEKKSKGDAKEAGAARASHAVPSLLDSGLEHALLQSPLKTASKKSHAIAVCFAMHACRQATPAADREGSERSKRAGPINR